MTDSSCSLLVGSDNDGADRFDHRMFTARIAVGVCEECPAEILRGDRYQRISLVHGDIRNRYRLCAACAEIADAFCDFHTLGNLWEDIEAAFEETPITTGCYSKLQSVKARAALQRAWIAWKGL